MNEDSKSVMLLSNFNDSKKIYDEIVAMAVIGSYNTEYWRKDRSDIDILILLKSIRRIEFEFELEETLLEKLKDFFSYEDIHICFLYMNEFDTDFAREYLKSCNKVIYDFEKEIDFRLYVNKYIRNQE